jgi:S1-C subfamily serine protease
MENSANATSTRRSGFMGSGFRLLLLSAILLAAFEIFAQPMMDRAQIFGSFKESVVYVEADGYMFNGEIEQVTGTGFLVGREGEILTNSHVVFTEPGDYERIVVRVRFGSRSAVPRAAEIVGRDGENDLALLRASSVPPNSVPVPISMPSRAEIGHNVDVMGFPLTFPLNIVPGAISTRVQPNLWMTNSTVNPGHSGGPVFNKHGYAIGVVTGGVVSASVGAQQVLIEGIKFFVPSDSFGKILSATATSAQPAFALVPETFNGAVIVKASATGALSEFIYPDPGFKFVDAKPAEKGGPTITVLEGGTKAIVKFPVKPAATDFNATIYTRQVNKGGAM